jgi:hypothetical protein
MKTLSPALLLPAHGPPLASPVAVLSFYVAHRHQRTEQIRSALDLLGEASPDELVSIVYPELSPDARMAGQAQITSHLRWMVEHGLARKGDADRFQAR